LTDLQPDSPNPFDSAKATLRIMETPTATGFKLEVEGIDPSVKGTEFGAHLHVGECKVLDDGSNLTRTHYNTDGQPASRQNEVWFDVVPMRTAKPRMTSGYRSRPVNFPTLLTRASCRS
jgi:hypothetical protein